MPRTFTASNAGFKFQDCAQCGQSCIPGNDLGPPICTTCVVAMPGPQMLLVTFPGGAPDFERDSPESIGRRMEIQVLHGGDPAGWRVEKLSHADVERWGPELRRMTAEIRYRISCGRRHPRRTRPRPRRPGSAV